MKIFRYPQSYEAYGLSAILNSTIYDRYFQIINGSTQVNASEIMNFPFPDIEKIRLIGRLVRENKDSVVEMAQAAEAVREFFSRNDYTGKRLLLIIPDNTRSGPIGEVFQMIS